MFDQKYLEKHMGEYSQKLNKDISKLEEAVEFFKLMCGQYGFEYEHDVTALEAPHFKTMNYTTYNSMLCMHPLQPEFSARQMLDAYYDPEVEYNEAWYDWMLNRINEGRSSKYDIKTTKPIPEDMNSLVVLPGGNKLKKHVCIGQLERILREDDKSFWKAHPITKYSEIGELQDRLEFDGIHRDGYNLYDLMAALPQGSVVYTSHLSESVLQACVMGHRVIPIDKYQSKAMSSFFHINTHLFWEMDPVGWMGKAFQSPKSGIVCPDIDGENTKQKIVDYFTYVSQQRSFMDKHYSM